MRATSLRVAGFALLVASFTPALALDPVSKTFFGGYAVSGYDTVAYFTVGRPVKGNKQFQHRWQGAVWLFSTAAHRNLFMKEPQKYAPVYGGYCAWAVAEGYTATSDPNAWRIVKGRLYLNYDKEIQTRWERDMAGNIAKGDKNWPQILKK